ncbi:hypothetical protein IMSAGC016_01516 [Muribaculaceae bacterium]|nr:hypothetical protein IMSAGC016_01516 [Muribaculaceae bacterium]
MNLLQAFHAPRFKRIQQPAFKQSICLLAALTIDSIVAIGKPVKKPARPIVWIMLGDKNNILSRQRITVILLTVSSNDFQFVSATHELNAILFQLAFKPTPIVTCLRIVRLIIDSTYNVSSRVPPAVVLVIPDRPHLAVIEKPYRLLTHCP